MTEETVQTEVEEPKAGAFPDEDATRLARDAFSKSDTYFNASVRTRMEADIRQVQGVHPQGSKYYTEQYRTKSKLFRPKTRTSLRKAEAACANAYFSTSDVVSITPEDAKNNYQHASAAIMKELIEYRLENSIPWFKTLVGAFQEARTVGVVASLQTWKYDGKKTDKPEIRLIPPENIRFDPAADWTDPINTSPYVIVLLPTYVYEARERWAIDEAHLKSAVRLGDSIRNQREHNQQDSKEADSQVNDFSLIWVHLNFMRWKGDDYYYYTINDGVLLSKPKLVSEGFPHLEDTGERPIVLGQAVIEAHKTYVTSHPTMTRDLQNEINTHANDRRDNIKIAMEKRWFVKRHKNVDIRSLLYGGSNSVTFMPDPKNDVQEVTTQDVTSSSYAEQDRLNLDYDDIAGAFSGSSVQSNRNLNETVGGMNLISAQANQMEEYDLRVFNETYVEPVLKQLVLMEQYYETDDVIIALAGQKANIFQKFGISEVTDDLLSQKLTLKVNAGTGSTNTVNQLERLIYAVKSINELFGGSASLRHKQDEIIKEIYGKVGYKDGGRFYTPEGDNPEIDNLIAQIQEMQAAIEQKHPPELIQAQIKEINAKADAAGANKVKILVESIFSSMQAAGQIAMNPQIAPVGDEVMKASGYQQPNPEGVDPDIPVVEQNTTQENSLDSLPVINENTSPMQPPVPQSAAEGAAQGIETQDLTD